MTYNDAGGVNIRNSCPITYILKESPAGAPINYSLTTFSGTTGYDGTYKLTLDQPLAAPVHETTGTYEVIVEGEAQGNSNKFEIKFILHLSDYCMYQGTLNDLVIDTDLTRFPSFRDYQHYDSAFALLPGDHYTIPLENFDNVDTYWVDVWSYSDGIPPSFFFPEMIYKDSLGIDLRTLCPISCNMDTLSSAEFIKLPVVGTEGLNGRYEF